MHRSLAASIAAALTLGLAGVAVAAGFTTGTYKGKTSQRDAITIVLTKTGMKSAKYTATYKCAGTSKKIKQPTSLPKTAFSRPGVIAEKYHTSGNTDNVTFNLTASGKRVKGSFSETYTSRGGATCRSGKVKFNLKK